AFPRSFRRTSSSVSRRPIAPRLTWKRRRSPVSPSPRRESCSASRTCRSTVSQPISNRCGPATSRRAFSPASPNSTPRRRRPKEAGGGLMPRLHVCSLALIGHTVAKTGARSLLTLLSPGTAVERPAEIAPGRHLYLAVSDIVAPIPGQVLPQRTHLDDLLAFVHAWDRADPMVIHCYAGVSRSTAAAFIAACALNPARNELAIARAIRVASPTATPNARLVALADAALQRGGRMNAAIMEIGRGEECFE